MSEEREPRPDPARRPRRRRPASASGTQSESRKRSTTPESREPSTTPENREHATPSESRESRPRHDEGEKRSRPRARGLDARGAVRNALEEITGLISHQVEGVVGVRREDESWVVTIEVLEDPHVPSTSDILAECEVRLSDEGELLGYSRGRRYVRGRVEA
jgi:hypothetical protein